MLDLMKAGMSGSDAMREVGNAAARLPPKEYPSGFKPPTLPHETPAAAKLGLDTLGKAILDGTLSPSTGLMDHLEKLLGYTKPERDTQVPAQKPPTYHTTTPPAALPPGPLPAGPVVTSPVQAPALGTGALVAGGIGLLLLMLFMGRR